MITSNKADSRCPRDSSKSSVKTAAEQSSPLAKLSMQIPAATGDTRADSAGLRSRSSQTSSRPDTQSCTQRSAVRAQAVMGTPASALGEFNGGGSSLGLYKVQLCNNHKNWHGGCQTLAKASSAASTGKVQETDEVHCMIKLGVRIKGNKHRSISRAASNQTQNACKQEKDKA